ncbi:MAG: pentapeptide repeat-containing protein [Chloroflexi bacterium]|nr:pentapeptide repeat-containing protein [Chloroflexota bacterium]
MSEQKDITTIAQQQPADNDPRAWKAYWEKQGQTWRSEPEISPERQAELAARRSIVPDVQQGTYPFKGIKLSRADVEWLLATHEDGRGPVDYHDSEQRERVGLDLRGADLSHADLQNLPLARTIGDVTWRTWANLTEEQHQMAAVFLQRADLKGAFLEGASLEYAHLEEADLRGAHLEEANLGEARMMGAYLEGANLEGADLWLAHCEHTFFWRVRLSGARLAEVHMLGAHLDRMQLANDEGVGPLLADVLWEGANLAVVDWSQVRMLGDEYRARQKQQDGQEKDRETRLKEYDQAVRANRQLAVALQSQGLNEDAARFAYRGQVLQRQVFRQQGMRKLGSYLFSLFLALLTGYGYRMWRIIIAYALANLVFASLYFSMGFSVPPHITWTHALVLSITAFHGRVFSSPFLPDSPQSTVTAFEAVIGLIFEGVFIAMLTQRFFSR